MDVIGNPRYDERSRRAKIDLAFAAVEYAARKAVLSCDAWGAVPPLELEALRKALKVLEGLR